MIRMRFYHPQISRIKTFVHFFSSSKRRRVFYDFYATMNKLMMINYDKLFEMMICFYPMQKKKKKKAFYDNNFSMIS